MDVACAATLAFIVAVLVAQAAIEEPVRIDSGLISGTSGSAAGVRVFKGVPFAAPPVGDLRWREPRPVVKWDGVRKTDEFGPVCVQPKGVGRLNVSVDLPQSPRADEDCLYLNVWTAAGSASERRPVMVWIFGGAYTEGAGSSPHNDGEALARKGVVAVTFNYRLGPFGFFAHPALAQESGRHASGNYAVMDAIAALRWVRTNIAAFGGDPSNVTIFGESAGAALSAGLVGSPEAKDLFRRAISESGAWMGLGMAPMSPRAPVEEAGAKAASAMGATSAADLRAKSVGDVTKGLRGAGMIADGWVIPEDLSITFAQGRQNAVDVLVGSNRDEGSFIERGPTAQQWTERVRARWGDLADACLKHYPAGSDAEASASSLAQFRDEMFWHMRLYAGLQARRGKNAFLYYFTHEPPTGPGRRNLRATHTAEIPYVFNNLKAPRVFPDASSPELAAASPRERALADRISSYWVNFARTGDPNGPGLPAWPRFPDATAGEAMILDDVQGQTAPDRERLKLYDALYAKQMSNTQTQATGAPTSTSGAVKELTALDYVQIQQLVLKYARALDTCSNNGYDYADLFTADGVFAPVVIGQTGQRTIRFQGREQLAEASGGGSKGCKNVGWIQQGVLHMYVNHVITPTAEGATGTVDMLMLGLGGDPNRIEHDGYYEDLYVKTAQGWRFKSRTHHAQLVAGRRVPPAPGGAAPAGPSSK